MFSFQAPPVTTVLELTVPQWKFIIKFKLAVKIVKTQFIKVNKRIVFFSFWIDFFLCTVKLLSPPTCSFCVHWCWYCTDPKLWDLFAGKQYNVLLIFKFLINYSPLAYISLSFFVYLSSDVGGLRSPGVLCWVNYNDRPQVPLVKIWWRHATVPNVNGAACCQICSEERRDICFFTSN